MLCFLTVTAPVGRRNESKGGKDETMPEWNLTDPTRTDSFMQYAAGGALDQETLMWQLWITVDGQKINWVAAYRTQVQVDQAMQTLKDAAATGSLFTQEALASVLDQLYQGRDADPQILPEVERAIRDHVRVGLWRGKE
jgi:hypothetical protein